MSEALRAQVDQQGAVDAELDVALGREVADAMALSASQRQRRLQQIARSHPEADLVALGTVRKFEHVAHSPQDLQTWGPTRNRMQASVDLNMTIVNLRTAALIATDDLHGVAWATDVPASTTYRSMTFGSATFWQTPLGLASRDAISQASSWIAECANSAGATSGSSLASASSDIRVVDQIDARRVRLTSNATQVAKAGDVLYVCTWANDGVSLRTVNDPLTSRPLMARIESRGLGLSPSAWLLGEKPASLDLRGAMLCTQRPDDPRMTLANTAARIR